MIAYKRIFNAGGEGVTLHLTQQELEDLYNIIQIAVSFYSQGYGMTEEYELERRRKLNAWNQNLDILFPLTKEGKHS